jgi:hypothetical protein
MSFPRGVRLASPFHQENIMRHGIMSTTTIACAAIILSACNRKPAGPEVQTTTNIQRNGEPVTLTGCLKRGVVAEDTFVLLVSQSGGSGGTATYDLTAPPSVNLRDQVGQQVEITGTLLSEQVASSEGAAREKRAKGTSGTPVVETKTDLDVKRVEARSLKPIGAACQP